MAKKQSPLNCAWTSNGARRSFWAVVVVTFSLCLMLGTFVRFHESEKREEILINTARQLAATALVGVDGEPDLLLLKLTDLVVLESVSGVRLLQGGDVPLSVGETPGDFPTLASTKEIETRFNQAGQTFDMALNISHGLPFDWLVVRLDANLLAPAPLYGTLINWLGAPVLSLMIGILHLWLTGYGILSRIPPFKAHLKEHEKTFVQTPMPADLLENKSEIAELGKAIENARLMAKQNLDKIQSECRFLQETPTPLLRCSVNRKVLFANAAARIESALFGDNTKEFVAPALNELVRKAFYEGKEVEGKVRIKDHSITFRAIPVLDSGYVNLYGSKKVQISAQS